MSESANESGPDRSQVLLATGTLSRYSTSGLVLLPPSGAPVKLNPSAAVVWEGLRAGRGRAEIVSTVADAFDQDPKVVAPLVDDVIADLIRSELAHHSP